ncbi:hypothetical protein BK122_02670 [Paenibacillus pabuli]|nr:hypothetical protein BK122_02670 [Paenibacillus pabuli]PIH58232.1 hypothetical protein CS562_17305 [Paenibacillus sp. LK1]
MGYDIKGNLLTLCYVRKDVVMMKKLFARMGSFTGYFFLIAVGAFYLFALVAIILLAIYVFKGGA